MIESKRVSYIYKESLKFAAEYIAVGEKDVVFIDYHYAQGDGDRHYCDASYKDGTIRRIFNPDEIVFK